MQEFKFLNLNSYLTFKKKLYKNQKNAHKFA